MVEKTEKKREEERRGERGREEKERVESRDALTAEGLELVAVAAGHDHEDLSVHVCRVSCMSSG